MEKWSIDQGHLMSVTARKHRLGLYLKSKDRQLSRNIGKKSVITNSKQLKQKKSADSYKDNYGNRDLILFWMLLSHTEQHIHARVPLHQKSSPNFMSGWMRSR